MRFSPLPVTLRQLQYVVAVAEELSFRRAAERCHVSQPSLSSQVAEVERMLDVRLFERDRRRVLVTRAGADVVERARAVLLAASDLVETARRHVNPLEGMLRVGVIPTVAPYLLPELDPALRQAFDRLELRWIEEKTEVLVERLADGRLDAALLALEAEVGDVERVVVGVDPFVVAAAPGHPLGSAEGPVPASELRKHEVLLLDDGHCFRDQALDVCARAGATEPGFRATSLSTLVQMAAGGAGVTLLPKMALGVENRNRRLVVRPFAGTVPARTIALVWRPNSPLADALRALGTRAAEAYASSLTI